MNSLAFDASAARKRSVSASTVRRAPLFPSSSSGTAAGGSARVATATGISRVSRDDMDVDVCGSGESRFRSANFLNLLNEGDPITPVNIYVERDLFKVTTQISDALSNNEDWTARVKGLLLLQGVTMGDGAEYEDFLPFIKSISNLLSTQILDLRSLICKEACRCIAYMAHKLRSAFIPVAELLVPSIMKQLPVKIAVMSSAAHRCVLVILVSLQDTGSARIMQFLFEASASKNPVLRRAAMDYLCVVFASWRVESVDKHVAQVKQLLRVSLSDADGSVRKTARYLLAVVRSRSTWLATMDRFLVELESGVQRLVRIELEQPSADLLELYGAANQQRSAVSSGKAAPSNRTRQTSPSAEKDSDTDALSGSSRGSRPSVDASPLVQQTKPSHQLSSTGPLRVNAASGFSRDAHKGLAGTYPAPSRAVTAPDAVLGRASRVVVPASALGADAKVLGDGPLRVARPSKRFDPDQADEQLYSLSGTGEQPRFAPPGGGLSDWSFERVVSKSEDPQWAERLQAFRALSVQIESESSNSILHSFLDITIAHLEDASMNVSLICIEILLKCCELHSSIISSKIGSFLPILFLLLGSKHQNVKDQTNKLLNCVRNSFDAITIAESLCPIIAEVPDRVKTAVLQFLGVIVPSCVQYFSIADRTNVFLSRLAIVLGAHGSRPSTSLLAAGNKLLLLVYHLAPEVVSVQVSLLESSSQTLLKSILPSPLQTPDTDRSITISVHSTPVSKQHPASVEMSPPLSSKSESIHITNVTLQAPTINVKGSLHLDEQTDIHWILGKLKSKDPEDVMEGGQALKVLAKNSEHSFWESYSSEIVYCLLEPFSVADTTALKSSGLPELETVLPLTGLSPLPLSSSSGVPNGSSTSNTAHHSERILVLSKILVVIARYKGDFLKPFSELLVKRICESAITAPVSVTLHCKQVLASVAKINPFRILRAILPFARHACEVSNNPSSTPQTLLVIQVLIEVVKYLGASELKSEMERLAQVTLPLLDSSLVDVRKSIVFLVVEVYVVIGDSLYEFLEGVTAAQRKLIGIYIDRRLGVYTS